MPEFGALGDEKAVDIEMAAVSSTKTASSTTSKGIKALKGAAQQHLNSRTLSDAILGLSDGLTVPFALTAGLASVGTTRIVVLGGLAELIAGAISMGVGGFVGAHSEQESYRETEQKCRRLIAESPADVKLILHECFTDLGLEDETAQNVTSNMMTNHNSNLQSFILKHHYGAIDPGSSRPYVSCATLGLAYFLGGFIALAPYLAVPRNDVLRGLWWSIGVMAVVLLAFGYIKTAIVRGWSGTTNVLAALWGAVQMLAVGAIAAGAAVGLVRAVEHGSQYSV